MKIKKINRYIFLGLILLLFASIANAQSLVPCGIGAGNANCTLCHLVLGFKNIYDYLFQILLVCSTVVIVAAGIMYMVSSGSKGMIEKAKLAFTYALTAMVLALVAWLIINATLNALGYKNAGNWWTFTCDTTPAAPQAPSPGGATLPGGGGGGAGGGGASKSGAYKSSGTLDPKTQKVIDSYLTMEGWAYGERSVEGKSGDCYSTTSRAYELSGLPSLDKLGSIWKPWDGNMASIKPGDIIQIPNVHTALVLGGGMTSLANEKNGIGIYTDGVNQNIIRSGGNLRIIHLEDVIAKYG